MPINLQGFLCAQNTFIARRIAKVIATVTLNIYPGDLHGAGVSCVEDPNFIILGTRTNEDAENKKNCLKFQCINIG